MDVQRSEYSLVFKLGIIGLKVYRNGHYYFHTKTYKPVTAREMQKMTKRWQEFHTKLLPYWSELRGVDATLLRELLDTVLGYEDY